MTDLLRISPEVAQRFPQYHALVLVVEGLRNGPSTPQSVAYLREAEAQARQMFAAAPLGEHPHIQAWHEVFRAFGAKPKKTLNSAEALISRVLKGGELPAINALTDAYNAVSVRWVVPCGGEDLAHVAAPVSLKVASGDEPFEINKDGAPYTDHPAAGEVVWADDLGVTCRAWNWRQGLRTRLTEQTTRAYFLFDALPPMTRADLDAAGDELTRMLAELSPGCTVERVYLGGD